MNRITIKIKRDIRAEIEALKSEITTENCDTVNKVLAHLIQFFNENKEEVS